MSSSSSRRAEPPALMASSSEIRAAARGFTAMVVRSASEAEAAGTSTSELREVASVQELPQQDPDATVEVAVTHSDLNYKDGLIVLGKPGVLKQFPIVPGIDYADGDSWRK